MNIPKLPVISVLPFVHNLLLRQKASNSSFSTGHHVFSTTGFHCSVKADRSSEKSLVTVWQRASDSGGDLAHSSHKGGICRLLNGQTKKILPFRESAELRRRKQEQRQALSKSQVGRQPGDGDSGSLVAAGGGKPRGSGRVTITAGPSFKSGGWLVVKADQVMRRFIKLTT